MVNSFSEDRLFRQITLELFSGLDMGRALHRTLIPLGKALPADHIFLQVYESGLGAMRTLALADKHSGRNTDDLTPMTEETRLMVNQRASDFKEGLGMISDPDRNPVARKMLEYHSIEDRSILNIILKTDKGRLCSVVVTARGEGVYDQVQLERFMVLQKPFSLAMSNLLEHRELILLQNRLSDDNRYLNKELLRQTGDKIIGADFGLKEVAQKIRQVAGGDSPVLITGETGVGKDVVAGAIHGESPRNSKPFIAINCGAIPEALIDSELFGHEKGAFTGAIAEKRGRFERASGGTIFLDEIGEMPLSAQVRLLRVLQDKVIERVGGASTIPVNVRIIAATNRDLPEMIKRGHFREDLWYRLNVFPIAVPPLRERPNDIPALVDYFINQKTHELKLINRPHPAPGSLEKLINYNWPGNVRELANVVERAIILSSDDMLHFQVDDNSNSNNSLTSVNNTSTSESTYAGINFPTLAQINEIHIRRALETANGKIHGRGGAGQLLDINPNTLRHRMKRLGINFGDGKTPAVKP